MSVSMAKRSEFFDIALTLAISSFYQILIITNMPCPIQNYFLDPSRSLSSELLEELLRLLPALPPQHHLSFLLNAVLEYSQSDSYLVRRGELFLVIKIILRGTGDIMGRNSQNSKSVIFSYRRGSILGQMQSNYRRNCFEDVKASKNCAWLSIRLDLFRKLFQPVPIPAQFFAQLRQCSLLKTLEDCSLEYLSSQWQRLQLSIDEVVFGRGMQLSNIYLIRKGEIQLVSYVDYPKESSSMFKKTSNMYFRPRQILQQQGYKQPLKVARLGPYQVLADQSMDFKQISMHKAVVVSQRAQLLVIDKSLLGLLLTEQYQPQIKLQHRKDLQRSKENQIKENLQQKKKKQISMMQEKLMMEELMKNMETSNKNLKFKAYQAIKHLILDIQNAPDSTRSIYLKYQRLRKPKCKQQNNISQIPATSALYKRYDKSQDKIQRMLRRMNFGSSKANTSKSRARIKSRQVMDLQSHLKLTYKQFYSNRPAPKPIPHAKAKHKQRIEEKLQRLAIQEQIELQNKQLQQVSISQLKWRFKTARESMVRTCVSSSR